MLNRITIMGRLVANPELRYTPKGTPVCSIRIACDRETKNADGEYDTDFIDVVAWRGQAENIARRFAKGRMAVIDGRLQIRPWTDRDGIRHYATEITASTLATAVPPPRPRMSRPRRTVTTTTMRESCPSDADKGRAEWPAP